MQHTVQLMPVQNSAPDQAMIIRSWAYSMDGSLGLSDLHVCMLACMLRALKYQDLRYEYGSYGGLILWVPGLHAVQFLVFMVPHACCLSGRIWDMDAGNGSIFLGSRTRTHAVSRVYSFR